MSIGSGGSTPEVKVPGKARCVMQLTTVMMKTVGAVNGETKTEAKTQALSWLATQLRWEELLDGLRGDRTVDAARAAA